MSTKYYKILKDTPSWSAGAIVTNEENSARYSTVSDVYCRAGTDSTWYESANVIESLENDEWFERVYKVDLLSRVVYETKERAKELMEKAFKSE